MIPSTAREWFIVLIQSFEGMPYRWAGGHLRNPDPWDQGPDCSGMIRWCLIHPQIGIRPKTWDAASWNMFEEFPPCDYPAPGCLVFWGDPLENMKIKHVETAIAERGSQVMLIGGRCSLKKVVVLPFDEVFFKRGQLKIAGFRDPFRVKIGD